MRYKGIWSLLCGRCAVIACLFLGAVLFWTSEVQAKPVSIDLLAHSCIAATPGQEIPAIDALRRLRYSCGNPDVDPGPGWLWLKTKPPGRMDAGEDWSLLLNEARYSRVAIILERTGGSIETQVFNVDDLAEKWVLGNAVRLPVTGDPSSIKAIYVGTKGLPTSLMMRKLALANDEGAARWDSQWLLMGGIFIGALVASLLYNLLLLSGVRHRLQLVYLAWIGSMLAYGLLRSSFDHFVMPGLIGPWAARMTYCMANMTLALSVLFFVEFFGEGQLPQWLMRMQRLLAGALIAGGGLGTFEQLGLFPVADTMVPVLIVVTQGLTAFGLVRAMEKERAPAGIYAFGWSFPFLAIAAHMLWGYGILGHNIAADGLLFGAMVIQALLLSAATAVRLGGIRLERDRAKAESERLRSLAETDPLTGLLNRRGFIHRAHGIIANGAGSSLLLIDVDHFKPINDNFGHDTGDMVLTRIGGILGTHVTQQCLVGRIGGEEFAAVIDGQSSIDAVHFADMLRRQLAGTDFSDLLGPGRGVTISIGLAIAPLNLPATFERLYIAADRALYLSKNGGRNRVEIATAEDIRRAEARLATVM